MNTKWITHLRLRLTQLRELHAQFGDLVRKERAFLFLATIAMVGEVVFQLLGPWPLKYLFDGLLMPDSSPTSLPGVPDGYPQAHPRAFLIGISAAILGIALLGAVCAYYRQIWSATAGQRMVIKLRKRLYQHLHRLPLSFHGHSRLGDLLVRITGDIPMLRDVLSESAIDLLGRAGILLGTIVMLFVLDPFLAMVALVVLATTAGLSLVFARRIVRVARRQREKEGILAYRAGETLAAISLVKAYGRESEVVEQFARSNRSSLREGLKSTRFQAALSRWVEIVFATGLVAILLVGAGRVGPGGDLSPGDLLVFIAYIRSLNKPLRRVARTTARIGKARACAERITEIFRVRPEEEDASTAARAPALRGAVELRDVTYRYDPQGPDALTNVWLSVEPGERIGIVGRNGAGKSTLVGLLLRFFDPTDGVVLMDGNDIRGWTRASLREQISIVLQETYLFGSTIRENLLFAAPGTDDAALLGALERVGADFVLRNPQGLDAELSEGGRNLSGGERRKIALAGALLRPSKVLILDEPTSSIDAASRDDLLARLDDLCAGRTTFVVTHDPQLLTGLDRVFYLERGRVEAADGHEELAGAVAGYRQLFASSATESDGGPA
ncbi:MAG: ABC transporter ATP-binding protein [Planctomycetota bacterium]